MKTPLRIKTHSKNDVDIDSWLTYYYKNEFNLKCQPIFKLEIKSKTCINPFIFYTNHARINEFISFLFVSKIIFFSFHNSIFSCKL
jgi:hypothetical protein